MRVVRFCFYRMFISKTFKFKFYPLLYTDNVDAHFVEIRKIPSMGDRKAYLKGLGRETNLIF
jgi:hypothetical protein